jgi:hypothetical protein
MLRIADQRKLFLEHLYPEKATALDKFITLNPDHDNEWTPARVHEYYDPMGLMLRKDMAFQMVMLDTFKPTDEEAANAPVCVHVRYDPVPIIAEIARLYSVKPSTQVWLGGNEGEKRGETQKFVVWEGARAWRIRLRDAGISLGDVNHAQGVYNTPDEHLEYIRLAEENSWPAVHLVGAPYHMFRIALGAVQHMKRTGYWTKMYFHCGKIDDWQEQVKGAQGVYIGDGERFNQLAEEYVRVPEYMLKPVRDLSTYTDMIGYLRHGRKSIRDGQLHSDLTKFMLDDYPVQSQMV